MNANAALQELITAYHELNSSHIDELSAEPSALEFMRYVAKNRPFVVRSGASHWPAMQRWTFDYLSTSLTSAVNVAITPYGSVARWLGNRSGLKEGGLTGAPHRNADAPMTDPVDGRRYFVTPLERCEDFGDFLRYVRGQEWDRASGAAVKYAQTRMLFMWVFCSLETRR